jgi:hypothetical protein
MGKQQAIDKKETPEEVLRQLRSRLVLAEESCKQFRDLLEEKSPIINQLRIENEGYKKRIKELETELEYKKILPNRVEKLQESSKNLEAFFSNKIALVGTLESMCNMYLWLSEQKVVEGELDRAKRNYIVLYTKIYSFAKAYIDWDAREKLPMSTQSERKEQLRKLQAIEREHCTNGIEDKERKTILEGVMLFSKKIKENEKLKPPEPESSFCIIL